MGHKDKGRAGLRPRFLEEQPLPAKEGDRERERERISDWKDADLIKQVSAQQCHCLSSHPKP